MINMITLLQVATIIYSRGDMTILAEAYAFGVVWSFFMKALGVTVLRFQERPRLDPALPDLGEVMPSDAAVFISRLRPGGAEYESVETVALGG